MLTWEMRKKMRLYVSECPYQINKQKKKDYFCNIKMKRLQGFCLVSGDHKASIKASFDIYFYICIYKCNPHGVDKMWS
jgi:hypothetical protein